MGFTAIPTSGSPNNQTYILGQFINPSQSTIQQGGKHGEIPKVLINGLINYSSQLHIT